MDPIISFSCKQNDGFFHDLNLLNFWALIKPSRNLLVHSFLYHRYILPVGTCCFFLALILSLIIYSILGGGDFNHFEIRYIFMIRTTHEGFCLISTQPAVTGEDESHSALL